MGDKIEINGSSIQGNTAIGSDAKAININLRHANSDHLTNTKQHQESSGLKKWTWALITGVIGSLIATAIWDKF